MSLTLTVDGDRWRAHLADVRDRHPGLAPVCKGNGYGFGLPRLARKSEWLGVDTLCVGTYDELPQVSQRYAGSLLVLTPWRPFTPAPDDPRVIHTVGRIEDLLEVSIPLGDLPEDARAWERGVDELAEEDEDIAEYVRSLEETRDTTELPEASGEAIAREFERYLKRRGDEQS